MSIMFMHRHVRVHLVRKNVLVLITNGAYSMPINIIVMQDTRLYVLQEQMRKAKYCSGQSLRTLYPIGVIHCQCHN
jgi:hypothetical protein